MTPPKLLTVTQVAIKLGVSRTCVHQWIREGRMVVALTLPNGQKLITPRDARKPPGLKRGRKPKVKP